jgi:hypothetical protein
MARRTSRGPGTLLVRPWLPVSKRVRWCTCHKKPTYNKVARCAHIVLDNAGNVWKLSSTNLSEAIPYAKDWQDFPTAVGTSKEETSEEEQTL